MDHTLLLWDIDGTLIKGGHGMRAMRRAGRALFGEKFALEGVDAAGKLDPVIFAEVMAMNRLEQHMGGEFRARYVDELRVELELTSHQLRCMPGVLEAISLLRNRAATRGDVVQGLLTGNFAAAAELKLTAARIDVSWFEVNAFGEDGEKRADLVLACSRRYADRFGTPCHLQRVIVIGDTPRDVECARAHGCVSFAVATGTFSVSDLQKAGADHVVSDLSDPAPLLALLPA